jgi:hypothetical protein
LSSHHIYEHIDNTVPSPLS